MTEGWPLDSVCKAAVMEAMCSWIAAVFNLEASVVDSEEGIDGAGGGGGGGGCGGG